MQGRWHEVRRGVGAGAAGDGKRGGRGGDGRQGRGPVWAQTSAEEVAVASGASTGECGGGRRVPRRASR